MSTTTQAKPENSDSNSIVGKTIEWKDLTFPCNLLLKWRDVYGVTENQPFQTLADAATQKFDFIRTHKEGWIRTDWVELIEVLPMPTPKPKTKTHEQNP